jgi:hypothetical protein
MTQTHAHTCTIQMLQAAVRVSPLPPSLLRPAVLCICLLWVSRRRIKSVPGNKGGVVGCGGRRREIEREE